MTNLDEAFSLEASGTERHEEDGENSLIGHRQKDETRELINSAYRYALSLAHNTHDAEDLVQQACMKVLRRRGQLVGKKYLFSAVRNLYIDLIRARERTSLEPDPGTAIVDPAPDPSEVVEQRMEIEFLLKRLRPEEREALFLNCVEGFTAKEIGELTGQPRGTVLSLMARAKKKLLEQRDSDQMMGAK